MKLKKEGPAFYDALADSESAIEVLDNEELAFVARRLVRGAWKNVIVHRTGRQRAHARVQVLEQVDLLAGRWE